MAMVCGAGPVSASCLPSALPPGTFGSSQATVNDDQTLFRRGHVENLVFVKGAAGHCQWTVP